MCVCVCVGGWVCLPLVYLTQSPLRPCLTVHPCTHTHTHMHTRFSFFAHIMCNIHFCAMSIARRASLAQERGSRSCCVRCLGTVAEWTQCDNVMTPKSLVCLCSPESLVCPCSPRSLVCLRKPELMYSCYQAAICLTLTHLSFVATHKSIAPSFCVLCLCSSPPYVPV